MGQVTIHNTISCAEIEIGLLKLTVLDVMWVDLQLYVLLVIFSLSFLTVCDISEMLFLYKRNTHYMV